MGHENIQTYWRSLTAALDDLETSMLSALIRSQRAGQVYLDNLDIETKWEWKLRNHSVKLKFSATRRVIVGRFKKEREEKMISDAIVAAIDRSCLRIEQL